MRKPTASKSILGIIQKSAFAWGSVLPRHRCHGHSGNRRGRNANHHDAQEHGDVLDVKWICWKYRISRSKWFGMCTSGSRWGSQGFLKKLLQHTWKTSKTTQKAQSFSRSYHTPSVKLGDAGKARVRGSESKRGWLRSPKLCVLPVGYCDLGPLREALSGKTYNI